MEKEFISNKQGVTLLIMFLLGSSFVITPGIKAEKDIWLAIILGMILIIPMLLVYSRLLNIYPGFDLFDLQIKVFGRIIGSITSLLLITYSFILGAIILRHFSEFIQVVSFPETPQYVTLMLMGILCIYGTKYGIEVLARWTIFAATVMFTIIGILMIFSIPHSQISNIQPILYNGLDPVIKSSMALFAFPFAEAALFTMVYNTLHDKKNTFKIYLISTIFAGSFLSVVTIRNMSVLGFESMKSFYFPDYSALSVINIANFFNRFEIVVAIMFVVSGFVKSTICLYVASKGFSKIFKVDSHEQFAAPIGILMFTVASFVFKNIMEMFKWTDNVYFYYSFPFLIIIPIIILVFAEIKIRREKKKVKG